jgi:hypothetical protein
MTEEVFKVKLRVVLFADESKIVDVEDPVLWQRVMSAVHSGKSELPTDQNPALGQILNRETLHRKPGSAVETFAATLAVELDQLVGACDPIDEEPFLHLDIKSWDNWRGKVPEKGPTAISAVSLTSTLLALWFRERGQSGVSFAQIDVVLKEIGVRGTNHKRTINNCAWLQLRDGDKVQIKASEMKKAIEVARAFATGQESVSSERQAK